MDIHDAMIPGMPTQSNISHNIILHDLTEYEVLDVMVIQNPTSCSGEGMAPFERLSMSYHDGRQVK